MMFCSSVVQCRSDLLLICSKIPFLFSTFAIGKFFITVRSLHKVKRLTRRETSDTELTNAGVKKTVKTQQQHVVMASLSPSPNPSQKPSQTTPSPSCAALVPEMVDSFILAAVHSASGCNFILRKNI